MVATFSRYSGTVGTLVCGGRRLGYTCARCGEGGDVIRVAVPTGRMDGGDVKDETGRVAVFTIVAKNYLAHARTLMLSLAEWHPELLRFVLLVDRVDGYFDPDNEPFTLDIATDLDVFQYNLFHFKYTLLELSTAVKPYYMEHLIATHDLDALIYLDPDIMLFDRLTPVLAALETAHIALTPHLTGALTDDRSPSERDIMRSGAYNLGFIALRCNDVTARFLAWWQEKLYNDCVVDIADNLFVDQRWIDLVPGMFPGVAILRDPGLNVAYWNLLHRPIAERDGAFFVGDAPLRFFHFSGFRADDTENLSIHQNRFTVDMLGPGRTVVERYRQRLQENEIQVCQTWPYAYGTFHDGTPVPDICRRIIRDHPELQRALAHEDDERLRVYFNASVDNPGPDAVYLTQLAVEIYRRRRDLQHHFPDVLGAHRESYARWFVSDGARDFRLGASFVEPVLRSLPGEGFALWARHGTGGQGVTAAARATLLAASDDLRASTLHLRDTQREFARWTDARPSSSLPTSPAAASRDTPPRVLDAVRRIMRRMRS